MSLNHVIDNNESEQLKIDVECKSLTTRDNLNVICVNDDEVNLKMPNKGVNGDVLNSDGVGGVYWGSASGSSGVDYQGINPVPIGTHYKISNITGSEVVNSKLYETSTDIAFNNLNITGAGEFNSMVIDNGNIETTGTRDLELYPSAGYTIRLHGETSAEDNKIINCLDPTLPSDVATKAYVDTNAGGISFTGVQPTVAGELLKFNSTDGSTINKSVMVEDAVNLNLGTLNITNVGDVDGTDILAFKTDYDSKINQAVKNTSTPSFGSVYTGAISNSGNNMTVNGLVINAGQLYGAISPGEDFNIYTTTNATKGTIRLHDEISAEDNKIINCLDPTIASDVATKNYVDNQISAVPTQVYDIVVPLTTETGTVSSTGIKYTMYAPRSFTLTTIKASLTTAQVGGSLVQCQVNANGSSVSSGILQFSAGSVLSNQPAITTSSITANDKLEFLINTFGDGTGVGLKITMLGTI